MLSIELQAAIIGAVSGGLFYLAAMLLRTWLSNRSDHNVTRHDSRVRFLQEQISLLYGPLVGFLHETTTYYDILRRICERMRSEGSERGITAAETEERISRISRRFDELYFSRINRRISSLLRSRRHLIAEERFPQYLRDFLGHAADWDATRVVVQELGSDFEYAGISGFCWPREIVPSVEEILYGLRSEYRSHLKSLGSL